MNYSFYGSQQDEYKIALLHSSLPLDDINKYYLSPLGITEETAIIELYNEGKKTPKKVLKSEWEYLEPELIKLGVDTLIVSDAEYFKYIAKDTKADANLGIKISIENFSVFYIPSSRGLFYNRDNVQAKIDIALGAITEYLSGTYQEPGKDIIHHSEYIYYPTYQDFEDLLQYEELTVDIESSGLKFYQDKILTIGFAWNQHEGKVFYFSADDISLYQRFFREYQGKKIFHHAAFDITFLIYHLYMQQLGNFKGMHEGLEILADNFECTQVIAYLALNSCAGNELGLKVLAQPFAGNYAVDLTDPTSVPSDQLMEYNLIDCLSTWYVKNAYEPIMDRDNQRDVFNLFMSWMVDIIQMQLTGMPLNMERVKEVAAIIQSHYDKALEIILGISLVKDFTDTMTGEWVVNKNQTLKVKRVTAADADIVFNPNSSQQLCRLLYDIIQLPVLEKTKSGQPATGRKVLKALKNHAADPAVQLLLDSLIDFKDAAKILEAFIPTFLKAPYSELLGCHLLLGNFRLGGTKSGRLSSNDPNLQQIPSGGKYGSLIKSCFQAPPGYLFAGLDFDALEAKIDALTTKDPNKLKIFIDGYDSHCFNMVHYWPSEFKTYAFTFDGSKEDVASVNSTKKSHDPLRTTSKPVTFALQYKGTYFTLMRNSGFSKDEAQSIVANYNELYKVSQSYTADKILQASKDGYITGAFGLRLRTPNLKTTVLGTKATPSHSEGEGRTAGNALSQSYCMLNNRAVSEFMGKVRASEYKYDINLCSQIHDASYYLIPADAKILKYVNDHLVKAAYWQELPEIQHPDVPLGGSLGVFYPSWATEYEVPKNATLDEIITFGEDALNEEESSN